MAHDLPKTIAQYYEATNRRDVDGMLAALSDDAIVRDEGKTHRGRSAIRAWMEDTTCRYGVSVSVTDVKRGDANITVRALVSGNFPNSPAELTYKFTLVSNLIANLEIG